MTINEAIAHARETASEKYAEGMLCHANPNDEKLDDCIKCAEDHERLAEWLEELKELRAYKERMEMQYLDDMGNPLEPVKLQSALNSEIMKYEFRKKNKPEDISVLDYTVMYALKHCLEEQMEVETMTEQEATM